ncbi:hypothetical protein [Streptomyces sp. NPDC060031]|uniref:hypothetical protein n=1 Tax=Streptomyces sp. NPDC060031 TaxID=3347043 RepID=UPI003675CD31
MHPDVSECERCRRCRPLKQGKCRFCTLLLRETEVDVSGIALDGGDQLWFGRELALRKSDRYLSGTGAQGRFKAKERRGRAASRAMRPISPHLVDPEQLELFPTPPRDWGRLNPENEFALTPAAKVLLRDFSDYLRDLGVEPRVGGSASLRTLRVLTAQLGAEAPIREGDVKAIATLGDHYQGRRVVCFLRQRGILKPEPMRDAELIRARRVAASLPTPFAEAVDLWIDVLLGQGTRSNPALTSGTIYSYVQNAHPTLKSWAESGITDLREITKKDVEAAIMDLPSVRRHSVHPPLRSLFRALRRERKIFRDPARSVSLPVAVKLPTPLPSDGVRGILSKVEDVRSQFIVALVAVHALVHDDLPALLLEDLDRSRGQLRVRRRGRLDHVVYLDELTSELATSWLRERYRRWPRTGNPHLLVSRVSAADEAGPRMSTEVTKTVFERVGISARKLRGDRIYDEARHTADPVHLMRLFGLGTTTAMKYITAAHPDKRPDPIRA